MDGITMHTNIEFDHRYTYAVLQLQKDNFLTSVEKQILKEREAA